MKFDYDVIILGSGPAGFSCAMQSSKFDKKVLIVESNPDHLGGSWINTGTVPSKSLREASRLIQKFHSQFGDERGRKPYEKFRMEDILQYKKSILETKNKKVKDDLIKNEVETARGWGSLLDEHTVEVSDQFGNATSYTAERILISTGSSPSNPENFEINHSSVLDYESILKLTHIPRRLVIVGSGIITFEYATIFEALGTRVSVLSDTDQMLPFLDKEILGQLHQIIKKRNIQLFHECSIQHVEANKLRTCIEVAFTSSSEKENGRLQVLETDHVLYVGGKKPNTENIGLDKAGVKTDKYGYVEVNDNFKTSSDTVYAAGDVIGFPALASASFVQGRLAACDMFSIPSGNVSNSIPYGIYSIPEISGIGLTEEDAANQGIDYTVGRAYYKNLTQADISHIDEGMLKLVFKNDDLKLLGVHIIGENAPDLIHLGQSVMYFEGDIRYFIRNVLNYPSYGEAYRIAAFNGVNRVYKAGVKYKKILDNNNRNSET